MSAAPREADACACGHVHSWHFIIRGQNDRACSACGCDAFKPEERKPYQAPNLDVISDNVEKMRAIVHDEVDRLVALSDEPIMPDFDDAPWLEQMRRLKFAWRTYVRACRRAGVTS